MNKYYLFISWDDYNYDSEFITCETEQEAIDEYNEAYNKPVKVAQIILFSGREIPMIPVEKVTKWEKV